MNTVTLADMAASLNYALIAEQIVAGFIALIGLYLLAEAGAALVRLIVASDEKSRWDSEADDDNQRRARELGEDYW